MKLQAVPHVRLSQSVLNFLASRKSLMAMEGKTRMHIEKLCAAKLHYEGSARENRANAKPGLRTHSPEGRPGTSSR